MKKQKITFLNDREDLFTSTTIEINVMPNTKILSTDSNVLEMLKLYENVEIQRPPTRDEIRNLEVISINEDKILLNLDGKHDAYLNLKKEKELTSISIGDIIPVKLKIGKGGTYEASFDDASAENKVNDILNSIGKNIGYTAKVVELIYGGYYVEVDKIKCFMPGSLAGMNKLIDFSFLLEKEIVVMPVNYDNNRDIIIVSHKDYLKLLMPDKIKKINEKLDTWMEGVVTGTSKAGIFIEFEECLTGLLPVNEIEKSEYDFKSFLIKPGDLINFKVKQVISDTKIILTEKEKENSAWDTLHERFSPEQHVIGKINKITNYGIFVEIEKDIIGLIHSTQLSKDVTYTEGDSIEVIINRIEQHSRKIILRNNKNII